MKTQQVAKGWNDSEVDDTLCLQRFTNLISVDAY